MKINNIEDLLKHTYTVLINTLRLQVAISWA